MREIINISLPSQMAKTIRKAVKDGDYISTSEFFRNLIRNWQEEKLISELQTSRKEITAGRGSTLKSLKTLR